MATTLASHTYHNPVMPGEVLQYLGLKPEGVYVDATLGGGGHTEQIFQNVKVKHVYAFDQDQEAISYARNRLISYKERLTCIKANFEHLRTLLALKRVKGVDGILFDLGVSSHQFDDSGRGFSIDQDGALDMRMSADIEQSAKDFINNAPLEELTRVFRDYGEEKAAFRIANWIVAQRSLQPLNTTADLSRLIDEQMHGNPIYAFKTKVRIFQALRIQINRELEVLDIALRDAVNLLNPQGRVVVISYHSLEDRIVKNIFQQAAKGCICPIHILKCVCYQKPRLKVLTNKPLTPATAELESNHRSRSAKLRAAEKLF